MSVVTIFMIGGMVLVTALPSAALLIALRRVGYSDQEELTPRKLQLLLGAGVAALGLFVLSIYMNPYGREISSSVPGYAMLPVVVTLLALVLRRLGEYLRLCRENWLPLTALSGAGALFFVLLYLAEPASFYLVAVLSLALWLLWLLVTRMGYSLALLVGLAAIAVLMLATGGSFWLPPANFLDWQRKAMNIALVAAMLLSVFLPVGLLYTGLRGEGPARGLPGRLVLSAALVLATAYQVFWDGVWSAAHDRAFEDHLPFQYFMLSLIAGMVLFITLKGRRRWIGPAFILFTSAAATLALILGWNVSAFELTERRAARVQAAVERYHQDTATYPASLAELSPRYLLYIPPAVVVRQGSWCYQGGSEGYRLGYISGEFSYFEWTFFIKEAASAGQPPADDGACKGLIEQFEAKEMGF